MRTTLKGMRDMLPMTVTIGSTEYAAFRTVLSDKRRIELYGEGANIQHSIGIVVDDDGSAPESITEANIPAIGSKPVIGGITYRVVGQAFDSARISVRLDLGDEYDNR